MRAAILRLLKTRLVAVASIPIMRPSIAARQASRSATNPSAPDIGRSATVPFVRPKVAELVFKLYGRPLHPELFDVRQSRVVERGGYSVKLDVTSAGHVITWRHSGLTLTEVAAEAQQPLPTKRRLMSYKLRGQRHDRMTCAGGASYQMNFQIETVEPEMFWAFQQELTRDAEQRGLLYCFNSNHRWAIGALSFIGVESRQRTLLVQAFHTFPDDYAIVKTQSLFEVP
jgi:hypothetical protein